QVRGSINVGNLVGGINWPGAAFDPETATFYGQANNSSVNASTISEAALQRLRPETQAGNRGPIWEAQQTTGGRGARGAAAGARGAAAATATAAPATALAGVLAGRGGLTTGLEGLPIAKPPYGVLTAIDLNTGETKFKVPHGDTPDNIRATFQR